jgi:outer membrane biosynthesis protein TonB
VWLVGLSGTLPLSAPDVETTESAKPAAPEKGSGRKRSTRSVAAAPGQGAARVADKKASTRVTRESASGAAPTLQVSGWTVSYAYPGLSQFVVPVVEEEVEIVVGDLDITDEDEPEVELVMERVYSKADSEVTLPLNIYPRLPPEPPGLAAAARTVLELTITTDGLVERVRMLNTPRNIHEFMLLSAAKAWRFEPATIAGRPVRFRHTMVLTAMP